WSPEWTPNTTFCHFCPNRGGCSPFPDCGCGTWLFPVAF
ncbi:MAG: hypothetical protein AVDCRST_MAG56-5818, partial [uncultured Cytophagales bacterium]